MKKKKRSRREKDREMNSKQEYMLSQEVYSKYFLNEMKYERQKQRRILWQGVKEGFSPWPWYKRTVHLGYKHFCGLQLYLLSSYFWTC